MYLKWTTTHMTTRWILIQDRMGQMDIQYLTGLKKFFTVYMDTLKNTEPAASATPKLASLLHTSLSLHPQHK